MEGKPSPTAAASVLSLITVAMPWAPSPSSHYVKVTLIPRGQAQGLTWFSPDEQMLVSRADCAPDHGALGGRAAEMIFGYAEVTTGAGGDIQQVASIARQMVSRFGMSGLGQCSLEAGNKRSSWDMT